MLIEVSYYYYVRLTLDGHPLSAMSLNGLLMNLHRKAHGRPRDCPLHGAELPACVRCSPCEAVIFIAPANLGQRLTG